MITKIVFSALIAVVFLWTGLSIIHMVESAFPVIVTIADRVVAITGIACGFAIIIAGLYMSFKIME